MKITELILKNFGKFTNKQILLTDGINIIYGENESGKTTLHTFLNAFWNGKKARACRRNRYIPYL
jgi:uncharacterized protein YhaN